MDVRLLGARLRYIGAPGMLVVPNTRMRRGLLLGALLIAVLAGSALAFASRHIDSEQAAYSGPAAPRCTPERLDASDVLPGTEVAVSPMPGSYDAGPETQISFLGVPASRLSAITVTGSQTGAHQGRLEAYSQGDGASFLPEAPFHEGETVTVNGEIATLSGVKPFSYHFTVGYPYTLPYSKTGPSRPAPPPGSMQRFHSYEALPPSIEVLTDRPGTAPGDIFIALYSTPGSKGPAIFDQQGQLVWMDPLPGELKAANLQVQEYEGKEVLTWWQGYIPPAGFGLGEEHVDNTSYEEIMKIKAGNGDLADLHDFHLLGNQTAVLTVFHTIHCNLSSDDGPQNGAVTDALYQEIDVKSGLVRREWSSVDHVALSESYSKVYETTVEKPFDFFHLNTIDPRADGTTLLSSRNTSAMWLIDTKTGQVIAKIGGRNSTITQGPGTRTAFQHDTMTLPDGDISIFDNGGSPFDESFSETHSRPIVVELNLHAKEEKLVREFVHEPSIPAASQGDVQLQPDGGWFVGWGQEPYFSEYGPEGELLYDARMWAEKKVENKERETESYRTYKFPWKASPDWPPAIDVEEHGTGVTVYVSWNGATEVASWRLLGGSSPEALRPIATATKTSFETAMQAPAEAYLQVQALNAEGDVIGRSRLARPAITG